MNFRKPFKKIRYSKDSRYTVSRSANLEERRFIMVEFFLKESNFRWIFAVFFFNFQDTWIFTNFSWISFWFYADFMPILRVFYHTRLHEAGWFFYKTKNSVHTLRSYLICFASWSEAHRGQLQLNFNSKKVFVNMRKATNRIDFNPFVTIFDYEIECFDQGSFIQSDKIRIWGDAFFIL